VTLADLSREDVLQILELIDKSEFDFFQLEMGDLKLTISKMGLPADAANGAATVQLPARAPAPEKPTTPALERPAPAAQLQATQASLPQKAAQPDRATADQASPDGLVPVKAPMVGTFYRAPEPGAPPFVEVGSHVEEDTTLGLIEVMKVFNSIRAGVRGVVAEILVQNAQFVEYGQTLFYIRPDGPSDGETRS